jgi:hypothetical protein
MPLYDPLDRGKANAVSGEFIGRVQPLKRLEEPVC